MAVQFKKKDADDETGPLVSIYEGMVLDEAHRINGRQVDDVALFGVSQMLTSSRQRRLQQAQIAQARWAAMQGHGAIMEYDSIALLDPDRLLHFASSRRVLR